MPNVSPTFILKTKNALNTIIQGFTRAYKFTGNVVLKNNPGSEVEIDIEQPGYEVALFEDWLTTTPSGIYEWQSGGPGSNNILPDYVDNAHWGIFAQLVLNISWSSLKIGDNAYPLALGGPEASFEIMTLISDLSDVLTPYTQRMGLGDEPGGPGFEFNDGVYFDYDFATNGNFWTVKTALGGARTSIVTSVPIVDKQWYKLGAKITNGTSVEFFIDDVSVGVISTNIPVYPTMLMPCFYQDAGDVSGSPLSPTINFDYFKLQATLNR